MAAGAAKRGALICSFLALALSAGGAPAASCGADCLARALVARIPAGETVALIPFGPPRTGIPEGVAKELQDIIQRALASASAGRHVFISRDLFDEQWRGWQGADFEAFLARQHIDVAVLCEDREPRGAEVRLSCTAHAAGEESALAGDMPGPDTAFPVAVPFFRYACEERARAIVEDRLAARRIALLGSAAALDRAWLPSDMSADPGPRRHRAAGRAVESAGFGAAAAPRAAPNLVRARLVAGALGHAAPLAFEDLAPPACHDNAAPAPVAAPANAFFAALAGLGLERAAIAAALPYRVAE